MESKCGLLQGGGCPSYLFADLCLEAKVNSLNLYSQRKLTPCASLFHGKPWMSQCWDNEPWGSKGRDGGEGTLGHLHIILFWIAREEIWEEIWEGIWEQGGGYSCVDVMVTKQTSDLKNLLWSTQPINYQTVKHMFRDTETSGQSPREMNIGSAWVRRHFNLAFQYSVLYFIKPREWKSAL